MHGRERGERADRKVVSDEVEGRDVEGGRSYRDQRGRLQVNREEKGE